MPDHQVPHQEDADVTTQTSSLPPAAKGRLSLSGASLERARARLATPRRTDPEPGRGSILAEPRQEATLRSFGKDKRGGRRGRAPAPQDPGPPDTKRARQIAATLDLLVARFPLAFFPRGAAPRALKIGIDEDLKSALGGEVGGARLGATLRFYVTRRTYLAAVASGGQRISLDGRPAGDVSAHERDMARNALAQRAAPQKRREGVRSA